MNEHSIDESPGVAGSMTTAELDRLLYEVKMQPAWRREADIDADFYDGNQLDSATLEDMQRLGMAPLIRNLIRPTIDVCLGMEAKTRADWRVGADDKASEQVAEALSAKLHEAEREAHADRACSEAYAGQIKTGVHWVEVSRELNPFRYPYRVSPVSRREIYWDWRAKEQDLSDARYLVRKRWQDLDVLELMFPEQKDMISMVGWSKANWDVPIETTSAFARSWVTERDLMLPESDWRDSTRKRLCLYEVWYRVWQRGFVVRVPNGRTIEIDLKNPRHAEAIAYGLVQPSAAIFPKMRLSWWIGPHRLADMPTPYLHQNFPYIPFWGYREDLTGIPYGLIRSMRSPQDEVNARLSKMMWLLSAKRTIMTPTAVDDVDEIRREVARPDAMIVLSQTFNQNRDIFKVESDFQLSAQQFEVMKDATEAIQKTAGVYQAMLGDRTAGVVSGVAFQTLVDQGTTTLAEINDNYRFSRTLVGQALLELVREDLGSVERVVTIDERFGTGKKEVRLNAPAMKGEIQTLDNDVQRSLVRVALEDIPSTQSYRQQQLLMLTEMTKALPPQIQAFVVPFILEASEMPHRREVADQVRSALGIPIGDSQTFTREQVRAIVQQQIEEAMNQAGIQIKMRETAVKETDAETRRLEAQAAAQLAGKKQAFVLEKDAETRRIVGEATVKEKEAEAQRAVLDTLLAHDKPGTGVQ